MFKSILFPDSGEKLILGYLSKKERGSIFSINDFLEIKGISYTSIRTVLVNLCDKNILIRISRGIYCYPEIVNNKPQFPDVDRVLSEIARKNGYIYTPVGDYAKYIIGITNTCPKSITCYTSGKVKTINIQNGISAKMIPSRKKNLFKISSRELMIVASYVLEQKENLNEFETKCIRNFIKNVPSHIIRDNLHLLSPFLHKIIK